jgi:hypothetical protein
LHRFGQGILWGVYGWLVLSLLAYLLAHKAYLSIGGNTSADWGESAQLALETLLPQVVLLLLLLEIQRLQPLARSALRSVRLSADSELVELHAEVSASLSQGFNIQLTRCKMRVNKGDKI